VGAGRIEPSGQEHRIFENTFQVLVRGRGGRVLARRYVHGPGTWKTTLHYKVSQRQPGTLEAVAFSPKDGALQCLHQDRVILLLS
jgi:hypothetical protein